MKPKTASKQDYSSIFNNFKSLVKKGRNRIPSEVSSLLSHSLFKTANAKGKTKPAHARTTSANEQSHQQQTEGNHKIDININVNYPKVKQLTKSSVNKSVHQHNQPAESNIYQNNLNISLTNYSNSNPFASQINPIPYHTITSDKTDTGKEQETNLFFPSVNMKEFTLKDMSTAAVVNEQTANFHSEISHAPYIFIKNRLVEGLEALDREEAIKEVPSLHEKYLLHKNALVQLGELSSNEHEKELIQVITRGLTNVFTEFQRKEEEMTVVYSTYLHDKRKAKEGLNHSVESKQTKTGGKTTEDGLNRRRRIESPKKWLNHINSIHDLDDLQFGYKVIPAVSKSYSHIPKLDLNFSSSLSHATTKSNLNHNNFNTSGSIKAHCLGYGHNKKLDVNALMKKSNHSIENKKSLMYQCKSFLKFSEVMKHVKATPK